MAKIKVEATFNTDELTHEQKGYGKIEVDNSEKDIVQIVNEQVTKNNFRSTNIVQVEKANVPWLIEQLQKCIY